MSFENFATEELKKAQDLNTDVFVRYDGARFVINPGDTLEVLEDRFIKAYNHIAYFLS